MVKIWTLNGIIMGLPQATELEQSSHEILDNYRAFKTLTTRNSKCFLKHFLHFA